MISSFPWLSWTSPGYYFSSSGRSSLFIEPSSRAVSWNSFWQQSVKILVSPSPVGYMLWSSGFFLPIWGIFHKILRKRSAVFPDCLEPHPVIISQVAVDPSCSLNPRHEQCPETVFGNNQSRSSCLQVQWVTCYDLPVFFYQFEVYSIRFFGNDQQFFLTVLNLTQLLFLK